ncbi:MAG: hypothetical protein FJY73_00185 [Candidatus Eisenbacteria bacterium]|nr:hypothetical protein [Candidatus Eisenbacteria bacterium]
MTTITHAAAGAALGSLGLGSPASFLAGMASHLPLDLVPHWDLKRTWIDTVLTVGALGALWIATGASPLFWGAAGAALPDLEHLLPLRRKYFPGHGARHGRALGRAHALPQALLFAVFAATALRGLP